jgi:L-cystine uptake protein TcyP (sodium:dicarboxylate symporter family)
VNIFKKYLSKPYPFEDSYGRRIFVSVIFGLFIGLFLLIFQPFDVSEIEHNNKPLFLFGFGFVTFLAMLITYLGFPLVFKKLYSAENWNVAKEIFHITSTIILISILNIVYSYIFCEYCNDFYEDLSMIIFYSFLSVIGIGAFPVIFMILTYQNILLKRNIKNAEKINQNLKKTNFPQTNIINIYSNNKKNMLSIESDKLIAIEANGNYINVYYSENGGSLKRETIRNTLKKN